MAFFVLAIILSLVPWIVALYHFNKQGQTSKFLKPFLITLTLLAILITATVVWASMERGYDALGVILLGILIGFGIVLFGGITTLIIAFKNKSKRPLPNHDILDDLY